MDPLIIEGVDIRVFDTVRGNNTDIEELILLSDTDRSSLRGLGINSLADLYLANTSEVASELSVSEVRVAEYKDNALESMRRGKAIELDESEFDIESGMREGVEAVHNVGRVRGERLVKAGYASVADIANAEPEVLREVLSVSSDTANEFITDARGRMRL